ncbi:MAG: hypothetical protein JWP36_2207 [Paucimonas sp.]|nr:hypothetical protein [Paucimonas sp.]
MTCLNAAHHSSMQRRYDRDMTTIRLPSRLIQTSRLALTRFYFFYALPRRSWRRLCAACLCLLLAGAGCSQLERKERELVFSIVPGEASWYDGRPDGVIDKRIAVAGSERLHAWWWPAARADAPALLYLHGVRWNLTGQLFRIEQLHELGFAVLAIDYRGFGESDGALPSEQTVYQDAAAAWQELARLQPDPQRRLIYGHSLGGAVAIDLAARIARKAAPGAGGLIVESTFTSLADIARSFTFGWLPVQLLLSQKFDSLDKIALVDIPVLIAHGTADQTVPSGFSEKLYAAVHAKKRLLLVEGATHNNSLRTGLPAYRRALSELFRLRQADAGPAPVQAAG